MNKNFLLVFCTCPNQETAKKLAHDLVANHFAACVNLIPQITSIYRWQNTIETAEEYFLIIKTTATLYSQAENFIRANHPYEIPEIIATPIAQGLPEYLSWLAGALKKE